MKRLILILLLFCGPLLVFAQNQIITVEAFFDTDPGIGSAVSLTFTAGTTVDEIISMGSDTLPSGFHILGVRVQSESGLIPLDTVALSLAGNRMWGITEYRSFYVSNTDHTVIEDITASEYFIDTDPGSGSGIAFTALVSGPSVDFDDIANSSALPKGFHTLGTRVMDANGVWSVPEYRSFYVSGSGSVVIQQIDTVEYFLDSDPGSGSGTIITVAAADSINLNATLTSSGVPAGFHVLGIRVKDDGGTWSVPEYRSFYVSQSGSVTINQIDTVEYFVDSDPGSGNGTIITVAAADSISLNTLLASNALPSGFHVAGIRVKDDGGSWSIPEYRSFFISKSGALTVQQIDTVEYFVDNDPGTGGGTLVTVAAADSISLNTIITADTLLPGFHVAGIRVKDEAGSWSIPEFRPFFVDNSGGIAIQQIDTVEYFVDTDPGVGNGTTITVAAADSINLNTTVTADTLSLGFHSVGMRVKDEAGNWGLSEYRAFFVSSDDPLVNNPITKIEYFYDADPGFGLGNQIPANGDSISLNINIAAPGASGIHQITVRALTADGTWSIGEPRQFSSLNPSRELDSLVMVALYNVNNGPAWNNRENWLVSDLDTWYGITLSGGRIDSINLADNGLTGPLPIEFAYITNLRSFDLSGNSLTDSVPYELPVHMSVLEYADISDNQLNGLPDLSGIATIETLFADNNSFDFGDLEPNAGITNLTYDTQGPVTSYFDSIVNINQLMTVLLFMDGSNSYQWYKDSVIIAGANADNYIIPSVGESDSGNYYCFITNPSLPGLVLTTDFYHLGFSSFTNDSLALVLLYNNTNGPGWTNNSNWLTGDLNTWNGVTLANGNVQRVALSNNNLVGIIPDNIFYLDSVEIMDLSDNSLTGYLPGTVINMNQLRKLDLSNNQIDSLPSLNLSPALDTLDMTSNSLEFNHIEANLSIPVFNFIPQDSAGAGGFVLVDAGSDYTFKAGVGGLNNVYQWFKNAGTMAGKTSSNITINNIVFANEGFYNVRVTNSIIPGLTIFTKVIELGVSSLQRDSVALVKLYETTNGDNWVDKTGWDASNRGDLASWTGVVITNNRISELVLPDNNLDGAVTDKIRDITQLDSINLSGNRLKAIPFMGTMANLAHLDVSRNQLGFEYLEPNKTVPGFVYNPQDSLEGNLPDTIPVGTNFTLKAQTRSPNNAYTWFLNEQTIANATDSIYTNNSIQRNTMGEYVAQITNTVIDDLTLFTKSARILANADISGTVTDNLNSPLTSGNVRVFKITSSGGFDTTKVASIGAGGNYVLSDIVLDDYVLVADPNNTNNPDLIPTYYGNTIYWEEADTIPLTTNINQIDIKGIVKPADPTGPGSISGLVEEDIPSGRLEARRAVGRATVSVTRTTGGQRKGEFYHYRMNAEELTSVTETGTDGHFNIPDLDHATYRLNIQYPGIPMDQASDIILDVTAPGARMSNTMAENVEITALVTPNVIVVTQVNKPVGLEDGFLSNYKVYPVPATDYVMIESKEHQMLGKQLSIVDMTGREMLFKPLTLQEKNEIDVRQYSSGLYILRIIPVKSGSPVEIARIIIKR